MRRKNQAPLSWRTKRRLKRYFLVGVVSALLAWGFVYAQSQWENDTPWWVYEDDSPVIPADVRLKLFNLGKAYHRAGDYHNDHFLKEYSRREYPNAAFKERWQSFRARWIAFSDYLTRFERSVLRNAATVSASKTYINFDHAQLAGTTRMVLENLVETARDLTFYLEDDIVIKKWEIFVVRLNHLEDEFKELLN